jgi:peptide methionine sulfoxide reductase MsrB
MHCLLGGSALTIDRDTWYRLRKPRSECGRSRDVASLCPDVVKAAKDHVIDGGRIDVVSADHCLDHVGGHVRRVFAGEPAFAPTNCGPGRVNDESFSHDDNLTQNQK